MAIAKNNKFTKINDLDDEAVKEVMKGAALKDKVKSKAGRKPKIQEEKATETMVVYLTDEQKKKVQEYCDANMPFSVLVRQILSDKGIL
jgi:predicted transcriptional regulator